MTTEEVTHPGATFPREFAPGVFSMGGCLEALYQGRTIHQNVTAYLIIGSEKTLLVDTGHPKDWDLVEACLDECLQGRTLDYLFPTHAELPHAGNITRLASKYPDAVICGDVRDYHMFYPGIDDRLTQINIGEVIDLGDRKFTVLLALMRDLPSTMWGFDDKTGTIFVSDAYAYTHEHDVGECAMLASELPYLPSPEQTRYINEKALYFLRYVDIDPLYDAMADMRDQHDIKIIAPGHGCVITNPGDVIPSLEAGYGRKIGGFGQPGDGT